MSRFIGIVSAYAYAVSQGYTGTEEEYAELMASYATVAEEAAESAESASTSATSASASATTATSKANEATTAAQTATAKAEETQADADAAALDASQALSAASTATTKASEAAQSASDAVTAKTAAQTAQTAAEGSATTAQTAAQTATQKAAEAAESARTLTIDPTLTQSGQAADSKVVGDEITDLKEDLSVVFGKTDSMMTTAGGWTEQTVSVVTSSYVYAKDSDQYSGQVNTSSDYGYAVVSVNAGDLIRVSGRANGNAPICVFFNASTPSIGAYVGCPAFVTSGTTYERYVVAIPNGVTHVAVNTNSYTNFPISVDKFEQTESITQLWQAGYKDDTDLSNALTVDGTFTAVSVTQIEGKAVFASASTPKYNGDIITSSNAAYAVIEVNPREIIRTNGQAGATIQGVIWLSSDTPSRNTVVGVPEYVTKNTLYTKKDWTVPVGVTHAVVNTINRNSYPISVEKFSPSKVAANLYEAAKTKIYAEPLHVINDYTGFLDLFLKVGCIGDSLASGESASNDGGTVVYHDLYPYSWGQFLARKTGNTYYNWSEGGLTTKTWLSSEYATECFDGNHNCTAYIIGLGENDKNTNYTIGTSADIDLADYNNNADSFYGSYGKIIQKIKETVPKAKIFILTDYALSMETSGYNAAIRAIAELFENVYLLDLYTYGQAVYRKLTQVIRGGHYGAYGYKLSAMTIATYINWIVQTNVSEFGQVEFIDTEWSWTD